MPGDSSGEDLPTQGRAKDGTQTQTVIGSPGGANDVPAHSAEFCPWRGTGTCRQHHSRTLAIKIDARRLPRSGLRAAAIRRALA